MKLLNMQVRYWAIVMIFIASLVIVFLSEIGVENIFIDPDLHPWSDYQYLFAGVIVGNKSRAVPDFAVVPVLGCPVTLTATEIVTTAYVVSPLCSMVES